MRATISYLGMFLCLPAMVAASSSHPLPGEEANKKRQEDHEDINPRKLVSDMEGMVEKTAEAEGTGLQSILLEANGLVSNDDEKKVRLEAVEGEEVQESDMFICFDEPEWFVSSSEHTQAMEPFLNMTCDDLESTIDKSGHEEWCNFHRASALGGKSAFEACCFCGGGSHVPVPCSDYPNWTLDPSGSNTIIDCEFVAEQQELCSVMKDVIGYGVSTVQEACCACGGGFRPILTDYVSIEPLSKDPSQMPSDSPSDFPSSQPSVSPSFEPSLLPSNSPSFLPSNSPSSEPSLLPSNSPSFLPSNSPSSEPSLLPSNSPSSPTPPEEPNPCKNVSCSNRGKCQVLSLTEAECQCENTFIQSENKLDCICPINHEFNANANRCFPPPTTKKRIPTALSKLNRMKRQPKDNQLNAPSPRRKLLLGDPPFEYPSSMYSRQTTETNDNENPAPSPNDDETPSPNDDETPSPKKEPDIRDWTTRSGLGESPGIKNLEFLGLGYDGLRGNPRGSLTSELDPGFRKRVFSLRQDQSLLTVDTDFTVPIGTDFKYISSCKYDSSSTEISTFTDYVSALSKEADTSENSNKASSKSRTKTTNFSLGFAAAFKTASGTASFSRDTSKTKEKSNSRSKAFSKNDKTDAFKQQSVQESTVSFEARAVCSEYEISFHPGAINTFSCDGNIEMPCRAELLDPIFEKALTDLPTTFNSDNPNHLEKFEKFIATYGTHYVDRVVLGAKRIFTAELSSRATAELVKDSVDVSSALSVEMQQAMSSTSSQQWGVSATISKSLKGVTTKKFGKEFDVDDGDQNINVNLKLSGGLNQGGGDDIPNGRDRANAISLRRLGESDNSRRRRLSHQNEHPNNIRTINSNESPSKKRLLALQGGSASGSGGQSTTKNKSEESSSQYDNFARTKKQSEDASKISSKNVKITEVNFGGTPSADWREWASSVREKPMPISYNLVGLWNLMNDDKALAFYQAFLYIEDIDESELLDQGTNSLLSALHFGVSTGTGEPHSSFYSNDPNAEYRALIQVDSIPAVLEEREGLSDSILEPLIGDGEYSTERIESGVDQAICGIRTTRMLPRSLIPGSIFWVKFEIGKPCKIEQVEIEENEECKYDGTFLDLANFVGQVPKNPNDKFPYDTDSPTECYWTKQSDEKCSLREFVKRMLPRFRAVTRIEVKLCNVQNLDDPSQNWVSIGNIFDNQQQTPFDLIPEFESEESEDEDKKNSFEFIKNYYNLTLGFDSEENSKMKDSLNSDTEVNRIIETAACDPGYIMDGIQIRKGCLGEDDEEDPLCIDDYAYNGNEKPIPYLPKNYWSARKSCKDINWEDLLLARYPFGGITGIKISCRRINGSADERRVKTVFCQDVSPNKVGDVARDEENMEKSSLCRDNSTWGPWTYLPEEASTDDTYWAFTGGIAAADRKIAHYSRNFRQAFLGVTDFSLLRREAVLPGSGFAVDVVTYAMTWRNKDENPVALFSSTIRGHVGENKSEEAELSIHNANRDGLVSDFLNSFPFAISDDFSSSGIFAMSKFNKRSSDLSSFSFLAVDDLLFNREEFLVAVVSNEGLLLNDYSGNSPISVKLIGDKKSMQKFELTISTESDFHMFAFPHWYTNGKETYPPNPASIAIAVTKDAVCEDSICATTIKAGSTDIAFDGSAITRNLGVNIFAVKKDIDNESIQVGYVEPDQSYNETEETIIMEEVCKYFGVTFDSNHKLCGDDTTIKFPSQNSQSLGERIVFTKDFLSLPSVIITPVVDDSNSSTCHDLNDVWKFEPDEIVIPHCAVETITKEFFVAKCACISYSNNQGLRYEPLAFNYFAVGPVSEQKINEKDFSWKDFI